MEIWTVKIECVYGCYLEEKAAKVCEIQSSYELDELCDFILSIFEFDNDHLHEFFISRKEIRSHKQSIDDESIKLNDVFPTEKGYHLFMNFDFGDDWIFKITHVRKKSEFRNELEYPRVIEQIGKNPEQYPMREA